MAENKPILVLIGDKKHCQTPCHGKLGIQRKKTLPLCQPTPFLRGWQGFGLANNRSLSVFCTFENEYKGIASLNKQILSRFGLVLFTIYRNHSVQEKDRLALLQGGLP